MDTKEVARQFAGELITHHKKLKGNAQQAQAAQDALTTAASGVRGENDNQQKAARTLLTHWQGQSATQFDGKSKKLDTNLTTTAETSSAGAKIVDEVTDALAARHSAVGNLVDQFVADASRLLDIALTDLGAPAALIQAVGHVTDLANQYIKESAGHLKDARTEMADAAKKLRALQQKMDHDGIGNTGTVSHKPVTAPHKPKQPQPVKHPPAHDPTHPANSATVNKILADARKNVGYHEGPNNQNKWGPTGQPWCAYFATSMWRDAGVNIPKYGFTGDIYTWGERNHASYDRAAIASNVKPGDAIMFGSGPSWSDSRHVGLVEKVDGNQITTIEGNSDNQVMRHTYTLPRDADLFYGGVHPK
jgi:hypothetical protein